MNKHWTLFTLGVIIFFFPFLGFPPEWKTIFLFTAGFIIAAISLSFIVGQRNTSSHRATKYEHPNSHKA